VSRLGQSAPIYFYLPAAPSGEHRMQLLVHVNGSIQPVSAAIRSAVRAADPDLPMQIAMVQNNLEIWRAPARLAAALAGVLGFLALALAAIGLYGVTEFSVSRRVREIGVRMALGASRKDVVALIVAQVTRPAVAGAAIGMAGSVAAARLFSRLLFGASTVDVVSFSAAAAILMIVAAGAAWLPARRATRGDAMIALRGE
jgi:putative ABC transport system permease protein